MDGRSYPRNSSSSFTRSSSKFSNHNPTKNSTLSNPYPNPNPNPINYNSCNPSSSISNNSKQWKSTNQQEEEELDLYDTSSIVGTCPFMCPDGERVQRERLRDLAIFERLNGNTGRTSSGLAVKKFCRTISIKETQASDIRPLRVLEDTLKYLLNLLDSTEHPFEAVHDFIFDRTRSIRQDLSIQNIVNDQVIHMYEEMVKFHIISHHKFQSCNGSPNMSSARYLNMEQLTKSLTSLYNLYEVHRKSNSIHENEAEFQSLYVLLHLSSVRQPMGESLSLWFRSVHSRIIKSQEMCFARRVLRFFRMGNYKQLLSVTATEASYLQFCIIEPCINEVRTLALSYINHGCYKLHPYPLAHLSSILIMKESDVESLCNSCGLEIYTDEDGNKVLPTKQTRFCHPKEGFQMYCFLGLERFER